MLLLYVTRYLIVSWDCLYLSYNYYYYYNYNYNYYDNLSVRKLCSIYALLMSVHLCSVYKGNGFSDIVEMQFMLIPISFFILYP